MINCLYVSEKSVKLCGVESYSLKTHNKCKNKADYFSNFTFHGLYLERNPRDKRGTTVMTRILIKMVMMIMMTMHKQVTTPCLISLFPLEIHDILRTSGRCNRQSEFTLLHFTIFH